MAARGKRLVLIVEDLEVADGGTVDVLSALVNMFTALEGGEGAVPFTLALCVRVETHDRDGSVPCCLLIWVLLPVVAFC